MGIAKKDFFLIGLKRFKNIFIKIYSMASHLTIIIYRRCAKILCYLFSTQSIFQVSVKSKDRLGDLSGDSGPEAYFPPETDSQYCDR